MKKLLIALLALLLLAGCTPNSDETTAPEETAETGLYLPDSDVEKASKGAVTAFVPEDNGYFALQKLGDKLVLFGAGGRIETFSGDTLVPVASHIAGDRVPYGEPTVSVGVTGVAYYRDDTHDVMCLNPMLTQTALVKLPEEAEGHPAVSLEGQEIFYVAGGELRALDMQTGISRLIKSHTCKEQAITGIYFGGSVLRCEITEESGGSRTLYISSETGQTLSDVPGIESMVTCDDRYFISLMDGVTHQYAFGDRKEQAPGQLNVEGAVMGVPELSAAVGYETTEKGLRLDLYDLSSGNLAFTFTSETLTEPVAFLGDEAGKCLWFLAKDREGKTALYRWDLTGARNGSDTVVTTELTTTQNPDEEALAACQSRVDALNEKYGVRIAIWKDAVSMTGDYDITPEYQAEAIRKALDALEEALAMYPKEIFEESMRRGYVRVCLVRDINGGEISAHYWQNKDAYISLTVDCDIFYELLRHMAYVVDSHTVTYSKEYDLWNKLNPEGFEYDLDLEKSLARDDTYITGENKAFLDKASMSFAVEDRCTIFRMACMPDMEEAFAGEYLQNKLRTMCVAIREAYGLEKHPETFRWEAYLTEDTE